MRFHAAPPDTLWINDPNALWLDDGRWRLLVQHRPEPGSGRTVWAAATSRDLLDWQWEGIAVGGAAEHWAYSGSAIRVPEGIELFHTVHDAATGLQHQARREIAPPGTCVPLPIAGVLTNPARNRRDPFVFAVDQGWRMLLAEPCDWYGWRGDPPSQLGLFASEDRENWRRIATIGPWGPPGVLWEVPVLVPAGGNHLLLISTIDRRDDRSLCSVRGWIGSLDDCGFTPAPGQPADGRAVDLGPDFYAAMTALDPHGGGERPIVAWLSSWATAKEPVWPGFAGGPITLPRQISVEGEGGGRLVNRPVALPAERFEPTSEVPSAGRGEAIFAGHDRFVLRLVGDRSQAVIEGDPAAGTLSVERDGSPPFRWAAVHEHVLARCPERRFALFVDGPAIELFLDSEGCSVTMALPGGLREASLAVDGAPTPIAWSRYSAGGTRAG